MRHPIGLILILGALLVGCEEDPPPAGDAPAPSARRAAPADAPVSRQAPTRAVDRKRPAAKGKPPFDTSRVPARLTLTPEAPPAAPPHRPRVALTPTMPAELAALRDVPARRGFDVQTFAWGRGPLRTDVARDGLASLVFGAAGAPPQQLALVRRFDTVAAARLALAARLAGIAGATRPHAVGDAGYAIVDGRTGRVSRVLFVRANLVLEARGLGDQDAAALAAELDRHAQAAPPARAEGGPAGPLAPRIVLDEPARAGRATPISVSAGGDVVAVHWLNTPHAAIDSNGGRSWLLSPEPGERTLTVIVVDRWLRVARAQATVTVQ